MVAQNRSESEHLIECIFLRVCDSVKSISDGYEVLSRIFKPRLLSRLILHKGRQPVDDQLDIRSGLIEV